SVSSESRRLATATYGVDTMASHANNRRNVLQFLMRAGDEAVRYGGHPQTDFLGHVSNGSNGSKRCWNGYVVHMRRISMRCCALLQDCCLPAMVPRNSLVCSVVLGLPPVQPCRCSH